MRSYPSFKPGQVILVVAIGFALVLGSVAHSAWAAPGQLPERQSVPTSPYTPTPAKSPKREERSTATPTPPQAPTATIAPELLPESGAQAVQPRQTAPPASVALDRAALALLGGGFAFLGSGLWLRTRRQRPDRGRPERAEPGARR